MANVERGIKRLLIVISGLIATLGTLAVVAFPDADVVGVAALVGVSIGLLWVAFFVLRWVARGFVPESEPPARRPGINWKTAKNWVLIGIGGAGLVFLCGVILVALVEALRKPTETWHAIVAGLLAMPLVVGLRQTVGDTGVALIVFAFAALMVLGLVSECYRVYVFHRQRRVYRRLTDHYAACSACQRTSDDDDDMSDDAGQGYCPVGRQLYTEWERS